MYDFNQTFISDAPYFKIYLEKSIKLLEFFTLSLTET